MNVVDNVAPVVSVGALVGVSVPVRKGDFVCVSLLRVVCFVFFRRLAWYEVGATAWGRAASSSSASALKSPTTRCGVRSLM